VIAAWLQRQSASAHDAQHSAVEAAYMAAFIRYHTTRSHKALMRLQQANNARFKIVKAN
jgi:hypothetical protein